MDNSLWLLVISPREYDDDDDALPNDCRCSAAVAVAASEPMKSMTKYDCILLIVVVVLVFRPVSKVLLLLGTL